MKSNQERSNECLPPKKREIPASTLPSEVRPVVMAPANESQRSGNLAWLASLASGHDRGRQHTSTSSEPDGPQYKPLLATAESTHPSSTHLTRSPTAVTTIPAVYTSPLSQHAGTIQYTPLAPNLHFISSPYPAPYAGYISPLVPPLAATSTIQREAYSSIYSSPASKIDQHHQLGRPTGLVTTDNTSLPHSTQYIQIAGSPLSVSPRTAPSPHVHLPLHLHSHHTLPISGHSPVLVQYTDGPLPKREETRPREVLNGELEKDRRFGPSPESSAGKQGSTAKGGSSTQQHQIHQQQSPRHYEARHVVLPADYAQDSATMRTSLVLVPNSHSSGGTPDKLPPLTSHSEKGGICAGKPVSRSSSSSASLPFPPPPPPVDSLKGVATTLSPHAVIQTTHNTTESLSLGLPSTNFYSAQQPIIGYIAGTGHQQPLSYHTSLPQHLVIPGTQPVIIPVSGTEATATSTTPLLPAALPHTFVTSTAPKVETFEATAPYPHPAADVVQAQLHLPVVPAPAGLLTTPPPPSAPSLPPYFTKGSIIQLADGELKRVEDLKTEDFIQSAEISNELKIDSSTVERIDSSHTPNFAIIQFAVGEHHSQVSVEVLVEYPFFVFGQGWSSCCPERTTQLLELPCTKLSVGDVCISLTLKNLRNGSIKKSQGQVLDAPTLGPPLKSPKALSSGVRGGVRHTEKENGLGQCGDQGGGGGQGNRENGELRFGERDICKAPPVTESESGSKPTGRKRRWSAPEGRKVENPEGEPPLTFPKPSFIPQEVKISIEGRSNIGK
ncbi:ataxin-1-like [Sinocyclocheilus anshuiensis]|uniref:Ataxin-1-like n=1 Tax=Sinocyclocheilus anshuiensis TaxID=1608454 RepID=A0A671QWN8_9TELE|nr:PREDICTED: ataxin-1-like [Sinocyclocheilus anshuiensis]XP_016351962.1 PREDICTED: ataxin-1-like [Sinocyclocheilus anshuiensis]XP_016351964.1 PREDICTED: ataxin-1-like [Sinocyclocheilus anshuiensis]XP_016351965.1 PREDICTED: ataxin-1-like [Sinocyclocheilus anshuiensis]XP_016351966.1 PREDICTED: ataxin-1-like [Sinocyclocheilus anshuiensis]XP_016351967.1 PREDICTED: ataxin-1-like [Sinocyclocheilus anshuiensis]